jgi:radical SAM superfamily enzyme YgiQ (UPF0313 family)
LAAILRQNNFSVNICDLVVENVRVENFTEVVKKEKPDMVGVSVPTNSYKNAIRIAKAVKDCDNEVPVVFGGPHPTALPHESLRDGADIVVIGEGEYTIVELAKSLIKDEFPLEDVHGISFKKERIMDNPPRELIADLDELPFPDLEALKIENYYVPGGVISGRGCPFRCVFCSGRKVFGGKYRFRSPENVFEEIKILNEKYKLHELHFMDDTLTAVLKRIEKLCDLILKEKMDIIWWCETRVDSVTRELLEKMAKAGCKAMQYGIESGDNRVLRDIKKGITVEMVEKAVKLAFEAGILVDCSFMIGHSTDTIESIENTAKLEKKLVMEYYTVPITSISTPFPGTDLYECADELGIKIRSKDWDKYSFLEAVYDTKYLTAEQIAALWQKVKREADVAFEENSVGDHFEKLSDTMYALRRGA